MIYCYCKFCETHSPEQYLPKKDWIQWAKLNGSDKVKFALKKQHEDQQIQRRINLKK